MTYTDYKLDNLAKYKIIFVSGKNAQGKSTLTSEAPFYCLFGNALRYPKNSQLLSWYYDPETKDPAFSQLGLLFEFDTHKSNVLIKRNIIGDDKYELQIDNDDEYFSDLKSMVRVPDFNKEIKKLLDIDEKKFSILYLKSPFSSAIFETDSDLLASITKAQYINELRKDFQGIISSLKISIANLTTSIEKQNSLAESIYKQLQSVLDIDKQRNDREQLEKISSEIASLENEIKVATAIVLKHREEYKSLTVRKNKGIELTSQLKTIANQLKQEKDKLVRLTERGKCPTCEQPIAKTLYADNVSEIDEKISKSVEQYQDYVKRLNELNESINIIEENLNGVQNRQNEINSKLRTLSNVKSQLETNINTYKDTQTNNDEVLKQLRVNIIELNDELSILQSDYKILDSIAKLMLSKNSHYINMFFDKKIHHFNLVFRSILSKLTKGKYTSVSMKLNNKPTLNNHIEYESLSTSERKFIDLAFVISYIVYLSKKLKLKSFILDEFFDNYDRENIIHIYNMVHEAAIEHDLQLIITTNMADYLFNAMGDMEDVHIIELE